MNFCGKKKETIFPVASDVDESIVESKCKKIHIKDNLWLLGRILKTQKNDAKTEFYLDFVFFNNEQGTNKDGDEEYKNNHGYVEAKCLSNEILNTTIYHYDDDNKKNIQLFANAENFSGKKLYVKLEYYINQTKKREIIQKSLSTTENKNTVSGSIIESQQDFSVYAQLSVKFEKNEDYYLPIKILFSRNEDKQTELEQFSEKLDDLSANTKKKKMKMGCFGCF